MLNKFIYKTNLAPTFAKLISIFISSLAWHGIVGYDFAWFDMVWFGMCVKLNYQVSLLTLGGWGKSKLRLNLAWAELGKNVNMYENVTEYGCTKNTLDENILKLALTNLNAPPPPNNKNMPFWVGRFCFPHYIYISVLFYLLILIIL